MPVTVSHFFKDPSTVTCMYDSRVMYRNFPTAPLTSSAPPECSVCDPAKIFLTSKISYLFIFPNPTHKTTTGTANRWETTSSNPNWPMKLSNQSINQSINQQQVLCSAMPFTSLRIILWKNAGPKPFCWAKPTCFDFSSSDILLQGRVRVKGERRIQIEGTQRNSVPPCCCCCCSFFSCSVLSQF